MSNPNTTLGEWMLCEVLDLSEGEVLTYKKLEDMGLDSVVIYKIKEGTIIEKREMLLCPRSSLFLKDKKVMLV